jgi:dTDP-4-dehydrorhamnose reductase
MKVLITGGTGLLGKALLESCISQIEIIATYVGNYCMQDNDHVKYFKLDIRDKNGYINLFKDYKPEVTIHTAGIGSPDFAEQNRTLVSEINLNGTKNIIENCERNNSKLIFISSNGIYDGRNAPYAEEDKAEPVNYYGTIKLKGEEITKKAKIPLVIVRPILMYGWHYPFERSNIVTQSISKLQKGEIVYAYEDVYVNPLLNFSCATSIWKIVNENKIGDYNIGGADRVSIHQLVSKVAEIFNLNKALVAPVRQGYFNELVERPQDTSLKTDKMEKELGIKPLTLDDGLRFMRERQK